MTFSPLLTAFCAAAVGFSLFAPVQGEPVKNQIAFDFVRTLGYARIDPIVNFGDVSSHVHRVLGASGITKDATFQSLQKSTCTTHPVQVDKSLYWAPALYHQAADGTYTLLENGWNIVYYSTAGNPRAFPDDFQILAGSPTQSCDEGPYRYFVCNVGDKVVFEGNSMPEGPCDSVGQHITFPSCWDGQKFTLATQNDHLVYPADGHIGATCPSTHSIKLPAIMINTVADASGLPKNPNGPTYALSFGDTTGCGMHADFMNGWNSTVLQAALDQCHNFDGGVEFSTCAPLAEYTNRAIELTCQWEGQVPDELIGLGQPLETLPFCAPDGTGSCDVHTWVDRTMVQLDSQLPLPATPRAAQGLSGSVLSDQTNAITEKLQSGAMPLTQIQRLDLGHASEFLRTQGIKRRVAVADGEELDEVVSDDLGALDLKAHVTRRRRSTLLHAN